MIHSFESLPAPAARRFLLDLAREAGAKNFDRDTRICLIARDTVWYAITLILGAEETDRSFGNDLLAEIRSEDGTHTPATMLAILRAIPDALRPDAREALMRNVERELVHAAEAEFHDGNVNHPLAAWCTLILGGEILDQSWATELGFRKLLSFARRSARRHRFRTQTEISEYHSLTYTALDLWFLAMIAEHAKEKGTRALALRLEEELWQSALSRYHAPSNQFAGPHSRSYQEDSSGGFSAMHCTLYAATGEEILLDPSLADRYNHPSSLVQNALIAILPFHFPARLRPLLRDREYPARLTAWSYGESYHENSRRWEGDERKRSILMAGGIPGDASEGDRPSASHPFAFDDEMYPGGWSKLTTYMTREFALGSADHPYVNGAQSDCFMLRIRRAERISSLADFRSAFARGVFNEAMPGQRNFCHVAGCGIDESYLYEEGRCRTEQIDNRIRVAYTPKRSGHLGVESFRIDLIFTWEAPFDELFIDGARIESFPPSLSLGSRFAFRDHETYGVIIPDIPDPHPKENPLSLRIVNGFLLLSMYNYRGPQAHFTRDEIGAWKSGFYAEFHEKSAFESSRAFLSYIKEITPPPRLS